MKRLCISILAVLSLTTDATAGLTVTDLRAERLVNPMSLDTATPRLGWHIEADGLKDVMQTNCHIIVSSTREKAQAY